MKFKFLTEEQIFGDDQLDILRYGAECAITDFSILLGGAVSNYCTIGGERTGMWWTRSSDGHKHARVVREDGSKYSRHVCLYDVGARPALPYSSISSISSNAVKGADGRILEVEYGEYPQTIVPEDFARTLERAYSKGDIKKTGKSYTTDTPSYQDKFTPFQATTHIEYEYNGRKYIRFVGGSDINVGVLSDGRKVWNGYVYWVEVEPIKWLIDEKADIALSKKILFSGVRFTSERKYKGNFRRTDIKKFMDKYFSKEIRQKRPNFFKKFVSKKNKVDTNKDDVITIELSEKYLNEYEQQNIEKDTHSKIENSQKKYNNTKQELEGLKEELMNELNQRDIDSLYSSQEELNKKIK